MGLEGTYVMFSPIEDFLYLFNNAVLGESTIEDFILFVGMLVAFIAFILWCCFPIQLKDISEDTSQDLPDFDKTGRDEEEYNQLILEYDLAPM